MNLRRLLVSSKILLAAGGSMAFSSLATTAAAAPEISIEESGTQLGTGLIGMWGDNATSTMAVPGHIGAVRAVSMGYNYAVAVKMDGTAVMWGTNTLGITGGSLGLTGIREVSAGSSHLLALRTDGTVVARGDDTYGRATVPAGLTGVKSVAAGQYRSAALKTDGTVVVWGNNFPDGRVMPGISGVKAIAIGYRGVVLLKNNGTVSVVNSQEYLEIPVSGFSDVQAISARDHTIIGLRSDGTVVMDGIGGLAIPVGLEGFKGVYAGSQQRAVLRSDRTLDVWGINSSWNFPTNLRGVHSVSFDYQNAMVLMDSTVDFMAQPVGVPGVAKVFTIRNTGDTALDLSGVMVEGDQAASFSVDTAGMPASLPAGGHTTFSVTFTSGGEASSRTSLRVLNDDADEASFEINLVGRRSYPDIVVEEPLGTPLVTGQVVAWDSNNQSYFSVPEGLHGVKAIAGGSEHSLALKQDGTVSSRNVISGGVVTTVTRLRSATSIAADSYTSTAIWAGGKVATWRVSRNVLIPQPEDLSGVTAIAVGNAYHLALKQDGTVVPWGGEDYGEMVVPAGLSGVKAIACGWGHFLALKTDGTVVAWGDNTNGETVVPAGLTGVKAIAAGKNHSVALKDDGTVVAWGLNGFGQTTVPAGLGNVEAISAGNTHTLALKRDGTLTAWGGSTSGQAVVPAGLKGLTAIASGPYYNLGLRNSIVEFGDHPVGQPGVPRVFTIRNNGADVLHLSTVTLVGPDAADFTVDTTAMPGILPAGGEVTVSVRFSPVSAGKKHAILRIPSDDPDETLFDVTLSGTVIPDIAVFTGASTAAGDERTTGTGVHTFPDTSLDHSSPAQTFTIRNSGSSDLTGIAISITGSHPGDFILTAPAATTLAPGSSTTFTVRFAPAGVVSRGAVIAISSNDEDENPFEIPVTGYTPPPDISIEHPAGTRLVTGPLQIWGANTYGQSTVPASARSGVRIAALGDQHTLALKSDGSLIAWGSYSDGQRDIPRGLTKVQTIAAGPFHNLALKTDGTVVAWGNNRSGQCNVPDLTGVKAISAGRYHSVALKNDGRVVAWGARDEDQSSVPLNLTGVQAIAAGDSHTLALRNDGSVVTWGSKFYGQLVVPSTTDVVAISAGAFHNVLLRSNGTVSVYGSNNQGQRNVPAGLSGVVAIAAGRYHTLALKEDGTIVAWGLTNLPDVTAGLVGVKSIAAGYSNSAAIINPRVSFGPQLLGTTGATRTFTIRNTGRDKLIITSMAAQGGNAGDFAIDTTGMSTTVPIGGQTTFTATFTPGGAGVRQTTVRLTSNDPDEGDFDILLTGTGQNDTGLSPLDAWKEFHFGTTANTGLTATQADFDGDGLSNLFEYAFGSDPASGTIGTHRPQTGMDSGKFAITYRRPVGGASGVTYHLQKSGDNLTAWANATLGIDYTSGVTPNGDGSETVTLTWLGSPTGKTFLRISATY